ncbi:MAG: Tryptophan--tRNA ligase [Candidatus Omnitrophica bacterium]|nr:Tryptophan--tRNA ligase [Candidatus Omnitrophota bacterium]
MSRILSGMRPTGPLHLGHLLGALRNWVELQRTSECYFMVADLHALMGEYEKPGALRDNSINMVIDWIACGIDPDKSAIFIQSDLPEHSELAVLLGMLTPLGWLERNPTYKEQLREIEGRDLTTYGFFGYPVLQAADILLYRADKVPVGEDQLAHLELIRELVRRFNFLYGSDNSDALVEPQPNLTPQARILGVDRRKMSKSYGNAINLSDDEETVRKKIGSMITDPERARLTDPGHPDACNVFSYYGIFAKDRQPEVRSWCEGARKGCTDCKKELAGSVVEALRPIRERRSDLMKRISAEPGYLDEILRRGAEKARDTASETLRRVRRAMGLTRKTAVAAGGRR